MTHEEFKLKIVAITDTEIYEMADTALTKLCRTGAKSFTMTVPPQIDDTDIILGEALRRFKLSIK